MDASISVLVQSVGNATQQITNNKEVVDALVDDGHKVKDDFVIMSESVDKSVVIASASQSSISNMQSSIVSVIEEIQFMAALSFENGEFVNEVDDIADQIKGIDAEISKYLSFFKTSEVKSERVYIKKSDDTQNSLEEDIFF